VRRIIEGCRELGVPALSLYAFSTENWRRSDAEVSALFQMMSRYIHQEIDELAANGVRVRFMGRWEGLPERAARDMRHCLERTRENSALSLNVGVNYGGRAEIVDAARRIAQEVRDGTLDAGALNEALFSRYLYVPEYPEVDLLIRTSGELRISNFMLWQISYAELYVTEVLWPDFDKDELHAAVRAYQARGRRFGARP
jgi:undecaprenyl diphosphate synthase